MTQFQYTAVNSSGKKLTGIIGAATEQAAREQLNTLGISILEIKKDASPAATPGQSEHKTDLKSFEFEAYDKRGRKVLGTIPAANRYKAFNRLMEEYQFEVSYVVPAGASDEDKEKAKAEDLSILKAEYESQFKESLAKQKEVEGPRIDKAFESERADLIKKVDQILEKIKGMLQSYEAEIKPENKKVIQQYVDKLLRIKSSTNLDYIEHTSEELLKKVQDQELFLHKEKMETQRQKLTLETRKLMADLHTAAPKEVRSVTGDLGRLGEDLSTTENPLLSGLGQWLRGFAPTPREKELKQEIKAMNIQVSNIRKIWLTADAAVKNDAYQSLEAVRKKRDELKAELHTIRGRLKKAKEAEAEQDGLEPIMMDELNLLLGWLLGFYLAAYFLSHYVLAKTFPGGNFLPGDFNLLNSPLLNSLLISIFLWYVLLSVRLKHLRYENWANTLIIPLGIFLNFVLVFNL